VNCRRCYYTVGTTETRCVNCGAEPGRWRLGFVGTLALACGLGIGWSLTELMSPEVPPRASTTATHGAHVRQVAHRR
jgi:hypothetical protein